MECCCANPAEIRKPLFVNSAENESGWMTTKATAKHRCAAGAMTAITQPVPTAAEQSIRTMPILRMRTIIREDATVAIAATRITA